MFNYFTALPEDRDIESNDRIGKGLERRDSDLPQGLFPK
jgi:hypothetical protein